MVLVTVMVAALPAGQGAVKLLVQLRVVVVPPVVLLIWPLLNVIVPALAASGTVHVNCGADAGRLGAVQLTLPDEGLV